MLVGFYKLFRLFVKINITTKYKYDEIIKKFISNCYH